MIILEIFWKYSLALTGYQGLTVQNGNAENEV